MNRSTITRLFALGLLLAPATASATNLRIGLRADDGRFVVAEGGGGGELAANRDRRDSWETFTLFDLDGGALEHDDIVVLRAQDGHFVAAEAGGGRELVANRDRAQEWERFKIEREGGAGTIDDGSRIRLRASNDKYLSARAGSLRADRNTASSSERFTIVVVDRFARAKLSAPFAKPDDFAGPIGFDHNAGTSKSQSSCTGHYGEGFPNCYDGHEGSDLMLKGWFPGMDLGKNEVIAAAPGIVLSVADGNADHCFAAPAKGDYQIQCPGNPELDANVVKVLQDDGDIAQYYHLKKGSVAVQEGQRIECGALLGRVGSSGISSAPHLHFQLERDGKPIDPYDVGAWAKLKKRIPQRTCNVPAAPSAPVQEQVCNTIERVFSCSAEPAKSICQGVTAVTGGCVAKNWQGQCIKSCADLCSTIERTVTRPCG